MEKKLYRAGADRVLMPHELGGFQVAQSLVRPDVVDFLGFALDAQNSEVHLDQVELGKDSLIINKTLQELSLSDDIKVLSIIRNGKHNYNFTGRTPLGSGDVLIFLGPGKYLNEMRKICGESL